MDYTSVIRSVYNETNKLADNGHVASYIPELAKADPSKFGVYLSQIDNEEFGIGHYEERFSIQSIAKVLSLSLIYRILGEKIWERVGVEPSGTPFNSLIQLEADKGIPRNPFINSGALVICDMLISQLENPKADFLDFVRRISSIPKLKYSSRIAESEKAIGYRNIALCNFIKSFGNIENDPLEVLDFYFIICSLELNCKELSQAFLFLANEGCRLRDGVEVLNKSQTKRINALMQSCGFYDESGEFTFKVGLPGKSGVSGGIIAIHPLQYAIAVWSPKLNAKGNSFKGMHFLESFTTEAASSIF